MKFFFLFIFLGGFILANENQGEQKSYFQKANELYQEKSFSEAIVLYEKLLLSTPENYKVHFNLGNAYYKLSAMSDAYQEENFSKAVFYFKKALEHNPHYQKAYENLVVLLEENRDSETLLRERVLKFFYILGEFSYYLTSWFFLLILMIITFNIIKKKKLFYRTIPLILVYAFFLAIVSLEKINFNENKAVITKATVFKSEPSGESLEVLRVNPGFIVSLSEQKQIKGWVLVEKNGTTGWVKKSDLLDL